MPAPFRFSSLIDPLDLASLTQTAVEEQENPPGAVPATVTDSWDNYRKVLSQTVPYNVNRLKAATKQLGRIVR
jgi:hypothetical protein